LKVRVEDLAAAALHGHSPTDDTCRWLANLEDRLYSKLAAVGLVPERQISTIGSLLNSYITEREGDLKPESIRKLRQTETKVLEYFDKDRPVRQITVEEAIAWRRSLKDLGLSEAAIRTHSGNVKTMLAEAKRRKAIDANPFDTLRSGSTPSKYTPVHHAGRDRPGHRRLPGFGVAARSSGSPGTPGCVSQANRMA
jgi:hypothetical protein